MVDYKHAIDKVKFLNPKEPVKFSFSICTLMTKPDQYANMVESYRNAGFGDDCEYLCIDNSAENIYDAYAGYNLFLVEAQGEYIILTHQDVLLSYDGRPTLERKLRELEEIDKKWGLCGNSGGISLGESATRISDPHGEDISVGKFPQQVYSLDENFIVAKRSANICVSSDLTGYHMYGPDICTMADIKGHNSYVIDFHVRHLSGGTLDDSFVKCASAFSEKYRRAFRSRWVQTSATTVFLSGQALWRQIVTSRVGLKMKLGTKAR